MLQRPEQNEYDPYFSTYIDVVPDGDILPFLQQQWKQVNFLFGKLSEEQGEQSYAPGKWKMKEVLGHISDSERVMSYWMLSVARGDTMKLPGYDQDIFVNNGSFDECTLAELLADLQAVRQATFSLLTTIAEPAWLRVGNVVNKVVTARSLLYIIAGHTEHHLKVAGLKDGIRTSHNG
ncbi:DinB superfamily protein [Paenibacillus algorifonticola]|uniref:DinB superfamily protein n=1 Tax=Paenibacillus algorifonticola TaxID=684063 RepID=A0A1I1ZPV3_9BACL|nr:DinB family protein [Paenibacillus algorifonticola]SFE33705.1 DinB superfamily protein [Paenibacillus algorifonticola]